MRGEGRESGDGGSERGRPSARLVLVPVLVAAAVAALVLAGASRPDALEIALVLIGSGALAAYGVAPRAVLVVTTVCLGACVLLSSVGAVAAVPVVGAVHVASRAGHRALGAGAAAAFLIATAVDGGDGGRTLLLAGWFLCAVVTGVADKNWQAYLRQTEQRALEAERTREEAARRRAGEERLRIARELHDSLTHSISIVKLQAGVAVHLARKRGDEVPAALLAIQEASGEAMRELRSTLDVLREQPPPGRVQDLVERARSSGLAVDLTVTGPEPALAPEAGLAVYRIVQEALTNAARHAPHAEVAVRIEHTAHGLTVRVDDDGRVAPGRPFVPGTGLTGMRERVAALGGMLEAGPRAGGGFSVLARLPGAALDGEPALDAQAALDAHPAVSEGSALTSSSSEADPATGRSA
ncbi:Sensor histidine kinase LiaS [Streptomyces sp. YIM 130001]|uniref:sensor histidine kinase n=1 Tax=Streptomyces sp. YIM 130001 TaxID=2259644 RepID=UPI000E65AE2A|nr:sensor histidine kinase [Streptomyces sp. YIM 130001]RII09282.1 Sensor histidine kinase LiaS [Streptomyces sp. YIM 130001]